MSWEKKPNGPASWVQGVEGAIRNPDGHINIAAYARIAHRERDAAVVAAMRETAHSIRALSVAIWRVLSRSGRIRLNAPLRN